MPVVGHMTYWHGENMKPYTACSDFDGYESWGSAVQGAGWAKVVGVIVGTGALVEEV
jgi:hypothetical protein